MIVADTSAIVALIDASDAHHETMVELFDKRPSDWILPWAILPEVDYLISTHVSARVAQVFVRDLASGAYAVEWGEDTDVARASQLCVKYAKLQIGLVDAVVIAMAERLRAHAIATLDLRDFGAIKILGAPKIYPRDL